MKLVDCSVLKFEMIWETKYPVCGFTKIHVVLLWSCGELYVSHKTEKRDKNTRLKASM